MMCCVCIVHADAAVRDSKSINRTNNSSDTETSVIARATTNSRTGTGSVQSGRQSNTVSSRASHQNTISRNSSVTSRSASQQTITRSATTPTPRVARSASTTVATASPRSATTNTVNRAATTVRSATSSPARAARTTARATTIGSPATTSTFGTGYNQCRDAYFTCMDQFCATANDSYRRCICSSRLTDIQERERALAQASDQLQDFHNLNIDVIDKTAGEVNAMLHASEGEQAIKNDSSESAQYLAGISEVLSTSKTQSLSTLGKLDIAGDINQIWATTDLASGENIANLTGEALYNAVHAQCVDIVADSCTNKSTLSMVVSAYGMYIENDCTNLSNALDNQLIQANSSIRSTEREMNVARLDNYNAHNSTSINDCIANVRADITAETACGPNYVHCLDITGRYLNRDTGEPIYSEEFYQLEYQISLDGDVLNNATNRLIVAELNRMRMYAEGSLDTCRDISDEVWDEFVRQALTEIYQGQQSRVRTVKNECMDVVNACYDQQSESLKDFSNIKEELLLGSRLELSEELCREKLNTCSRLYGDPDGEGLQLLVDAMADLTDQKILSNCRDLLTTFAQETCTVPSNDTLHTYPYGCRVYSPGDHIYASDMACNRAEGVSVPADSSVVVDIGVNLPDNGYMCLTQIVFYSCAPGFFLATQNDGNWVPTTTEVVNNRCLPCPTGYTCNGGKDAPVAGTVGGTSLDCGDDYVGSLYQKMTQYALETCLRPSFYEELNATDSTATVPIAVLQDINIVMDSVRRDMATQLSAECERLGGTWVDTQWVDNANDTADGVHDKTGHTQLKYFYDETGANSKWGYCADTSSIESLSDTP